MLTSAFLLPEPATNTLSETNSSPLKNQWLEDEISFWERLFSGLNC